MIDHILGRPSVNFRKVQVLAVVSFWSFYILEGNKNGPPILRKLSKRLSHKITPWQTMVLTMLWLYLTRNFAKICNLESPEPLANLYTRSFFRATWITTALDAGFWTAMRIKQKWLRNIMSLVCTVYYLIAAEQADDKVRRVRATLTVDHLRVSWNKSTTPYLALFTNIMRPKFTKYTPKKIRIPRPPESSYKEPVTAWLYYDGPFSSISRHDKIILDIPGGGFVAMTPRNHDDKLLAWSGKTGLPVLSLEYRKAPEYPYPYALNECYDVYHTLVGSNGRCIGLSSEKDVKIVVAGDSAGGNLATSMVLMLLQNSKLRGNRRLGTTDLPLPEGLILLYPALEMNMNSWMTDEQMSLIRSQKGKEANRRLLRKKSQDFYRHDPTTPQPSDDEEESIDPPGKDAAQPQTSALISDDDLDSPIETKKQTSTLSTQTAALAASRPKRLKTRLAMSSMISYFSDRVLTPEMMRAMVILYIGPHTRPDFTTEYLLSPILAPDVLLANFPKVYFLTGERDPLVDDTILFAGRLRAAKYAAWTQRRELGLERSKGQFEERDHVEVNIIPGISHGFAQFVSVYPEGWKYIFRCSRWMMDLFERADAKGLDISTRVAEKKRHHFRTVTEGSSGDEERPLEMTTIIPNGGGTAEAGRSTAKTKAKANPDEAEETRRKDSDSRPASEENLLKRRMRGFTAGLIGESSET